MQRPHHGFLLIAATLLTGCAGEEPAAGGDAASARVAPRTYELPYRGSVTLEVPVGWEEEIRRAPGGLATAVEYRPAEGDAFRIALNIRWSLAGDPTFNAPEAIDRYTRENLDVLDGTYVEDDVPVESLEGPQIRGAMFRVTHTGDELMDGRFNRRVQAVLAVEDLLVGAALIAMDTDAALERRFVEMLSGIARLRPSDLAAGVAGPVLGAGSLANPGAGYHMNVPDGWKLRPVSNTQLVMLDREGPATFSILLKPAMGEIADEFALLEEGMRSRPGVEIVDQRGDTVGSLPAIRLESRATVGEVSFSTRNYVTLFGGAAYFMGVETADAVRDEVFAEVETMVDSIEFGLESSVSE